MIQPNRVILIGELDRQTATELVMREGAGSFEELREETASLLRDEVSAMNVGNFIVRPRRRLVEK